MALRTFEHAALHRRSREQLLDHLRRRVESPSGLLLFAGAENPDRHSSDHEPIFRQESTFHYLFGVREPGFSGAIDAASGRSWLFCPKLPAEYALWMGPIATPDELRQVYEVDAVHYCEDFGSVLADLAPPRLFVQKGKNSDSGSIVDSSPPMLQPLRDRFEVDEMVLHEAVLESRVHKHEYEVQILRKVNLISSTAHLRMMKSVLVGQWEYMLESNFRHECYHKGGCRLLSYTPIVGSGPNAAVLHYGHAGAPNDRRMQDGDIVLCDLGAELHCYASDITNSFPVNGKFTADQRFVFETVAAMQSAVMAAMRPGVDWSAMQTLAYDVLYDKLCAAKLLHGNQQELRDANVGAVFMPHGLGHLMGIDTHDVGGYPSGAQRDSRGGFKALRMQRVLEPGMVLTVEPGLYFMQYALDTAKADPKLARLINWTSLERFKNFGGVRLEDNVLVVPDGIENLTVAPRTVDEVEAVMSGAAPVEAEAFLDWRNSHAPKDAKRARI